MAERKKGKAPADDDILFLDADQETGEESLDDILKEAQASADRITERQKQRTQERAAAADAGADPPEEIQEEIIIEEEAAPVAPPRPVGPTKDQRRIAELESEIDRQKVEITDLRDAVARKIADFDNFRKRMQRDKDEFQKYAHSGILKDLLPVLDNFERAMSVDREADAQSIRQGVELIMKQFRDALGRFGLKEIVSIGQEFDPNFHEAVASEERADFPSNTVVSELQKGYMHHDRLLRAACVKVAVAPAGADEAVPAAADPSVASGDGDGTSPGGSEGG
ncbi:MAG: nucleotide exchange factor GrpE [Acidobacteriota bacterium]